MNIQSIGARLRLLATLAGTVSILSGCGGGSAPPGDTHIAAAPNELREMPVLKSRNGLLDILMIAHPQVAPELTPMKPVAWVYTVCERPADGSTACPAGSGTINDYGGTRLQVWPGDTLKVHLVNQLPPLTTAKHAAEPGESFLSLNPTNLHTHGMLVSARYADASDRSWGDNVFVYALNPANGRPGGDAMMHGVTQDSSVDYTYHIPADHPSGLFWFHPHVHGISLNQIEAGLSGLITVGEVSDYLCSDDSCRSITEQIPVRHMLLKDTQVLADGTIQNQLDPGFCKDAFGDVTNDPTRNGSCDGADGSDTDDQTNYAGGKWFFTINGQKYPTMTIGAPFGQVWRITNSSPSMTYDLNVYETQEKREMLMQVIAIDGVSVDVGAGTSSQQLVDMAGNKFQPVPCPESLGGASPGVCTTRLHLMPSSRAEVWVTYRDAAGKVQRPPAGSHAILRNSRYQTGPTGDDWPATNLAQINFVTGTVMYHQLSVHGQAKVMSIPRAIAKAMRFTNEDVATDPNCAPLAAGHKRRIFFNVPADNPDAFGLGYEEIDERGVPVPGTFIDVKPFDPTTPTVCVPLARGNGPTFERWELVNLAGEDHNFHLHQVHFAVLSHAEIASTALPGQIAGHGVLMDNLPLPHADGSCATVDDWRAGKCTAHVATVEIPFTVAGDFVYHCHILEHEDGGMMAVIRVRPDATQTTVFQKVLTRLGLGKAAPVPHSPFGLDPQICRSRGGKPAQSKSSRLVQGQQQSLPSRSAQSLPPAAQSPI